MSRDTRVIGLPSDITNRVFAITALGILKTIVPKERERERDKSIWS